jgi:hypothetical protein
LIAVDQIENAEHFVSLHVDPDTGLPLIALDDSREGG